jgi:hypothetical protein
LASGEAGFLQARSAFNAIQFLSPWMKKAPANTGRGCFLDCEEAKLSHTTVIRPADDDMIEHFDFKELTGAN